MVKVIGSYLRVNVSVSFCKCGDDGAQELRRKGSIMLERRAGNSRYASGTYTCSVCRWSRGAKEQWSWWGHWKWCGGVSLRLETTVMDRIANCRPDNLLTGRMHIYIGSLVIGARWCKSTIRQLGYSMLLVTEETVVTKVTEVSAVTEVTRTASENLGSWLVASLPYEAITLQAAFFA